MNKKSILMTMLLGLVCLGGGAQSIENLRDESYSYIKVNSASEISSTDTYVLVYNNSGSLSVASKNSSSKGIALASVTVVGNSFTFSNENTAFVTISGSKIKNQENKYLTLGSKLSWGDSGSTLTFTWQNDGGFTLKSGSYYVVHTNVLTVGTSNPCKLYLYKQVANQTYNQTINAYANNNDNKGYYLIASPVGTVAPSVSNGLLSGTYDLYRFDQKGDSEGKEWINYEASNFNLEPGKGYLYANNASTDLVFTGVPYNDPVVTLEKTDQEVRFPGWNLVGNPLAQTTYISKSFYTLNDGEDGDRSRVVPSTRNYINPMEGIFVVADYNEEELTFSTTQLEPSQQISMNVLGKVAATRSTTALDRAIVRFGECDALPKFQLNPNHTKLYFTANDNDYAVVNPAENGEMPVNFKAEQNGTYTLSVEIENVKMNYLHLIDNMTGADVDLLATPTYTFNARTTDYASRFKLVFTATGIEENPSTGSGTFAYNNGSEWVIANEGAATLQVVDMMGRILSSETISGSCSKAINVATGVYMLRLINGNDVKVQKIVVKR